MDDESYRLTVTPQGVQVVGADYGGVFNGLQTLLQLLPPEVYTGQATLPLAVDACRIEDAPRFHYRGMMLDVVRTWMDADRVKRHIDLLSHLKINKLHLLLSNDEGWRLEIKSHPELTEIGGLARRRFTRDARLRQMGREIRRVLYAGTRCAT